MGDPDMKRKVINLNGIDPDAAYSMNLPFLGHAVIINNLGKEFKGTKVDVEALQETFSLMGFNVHVYNDCTKQEMWKILSKFTRDEEHVLSNCFLMVVLCHGTKKGKLLDVDERKAFDIDQLIEEVAATNGLNGKPKLFILDACRGEEDTHQNRSKASPDSEGEESNGAARKWPDLTDVFVAYPTMPGYQAHGGDDDGSIYQQSLALCMKNYFRSHDLCAIHRMVKQIMAREDQGDNTLQPAEERNGLRYLLRFGDFKGQPGSLSNHTTNHLSDATTPKSTNAQQTNSPKADKKIKIQHRKLSIRHRTERNTGFPVLKGTRFSMTQTTGDVVLFARASESEPTAFHFFKNTSSGLSKKDRTLSSLCKHKESTFILPVVIENRELLAVSCWWCHKIRLYNADTGEVTTALNDRSCRPGFMCEGGHGKIFCVGDVNGAVQIFEVNCAQPKFSIGRIIQTSLKRHYGICYIPQSDQIVVSNWRESLITALSCNSGEIVWEVKGAIEGVDCCPCGLVYSLEHEALLVADGPNCRVVVLNPKDGSVIQIKKFGDDFGGVIEMCLCKDKVVVLHCRVGDVFKILEFYLKKTLN